VKFLPVYRYINLLSRAFVRKIEWTGYTEKHPEAALHSVKSGRSIGEFGRTFNVVKLAIQLLLKTESKKTSHLGKEVAAVDEQERDSYYEEFDEIGGNELCDDKPDDADAFHSDIQVCSFCGECGRSGGLWYM
jgi:hypothetical protein